jgi:DNA-binding MltR family transcriptional regulator
MTQSDADFEERTEGFDRMVKGLRKESDRGKVLIAVAFVDESLKQILEEFLATGKTANKMLKVDGMLGSYQSRIDMSYVLGLIDVKEKEVLEVFGKARNDLAHRWEEIDWSDKKLLAKLKELPNIREGMELPDNGRDRFNRMLGQIGFRLIVRKFEARDEKRRIRDARKNPFLGNKKD